MDVLMREAYAPVSVLSFDEVPPTCWSRILRIDSTRIRKYIQVPIEKTWDRSAPQIIAGEDKR